MALIALGVTGGIGAYKAVEVARGLQKRGHEVVAVMTQRATRFVGPITFEAITRRRVITDQFEAGANADIEHIALASTIDLLLIAPATANIIGKLANGIADDFLSTLYTGDARAGAARAGDEHADVRARGGAGEPRHARGARRRGSSSRARAIWRAGGSARAGWPSRTRSSPRPRRSCGPRGRCAGSACSSPPVRPTKTSIRCATSATDRAAAWASRSPRRRRGAARDVTLVAGPTTIEAPAVREVVRGAQRRRDARGRHVARGRRMDVVVMAAAVADYAPAERAGQKVAKDGDTLTLVLKKTPDILGELGPAARSRRAAVRCWSASPRRPRMSSPRAAAKRESKHVDLIVANDVSRPDAGFDVDTNEVTIVGADGAEALPLQTQGARGRARSSIASNS